MILGFLLLIINTVIAGVGITQAGDNVASDFVIATTNEALKSIKNAEASNADVSDLVERFNVAIDLQEQAERGSYQSCPSYNECIVESNRIMLSIVEDSAVVGNQVTLRSEQANAMIFTVYVPIGSFALSILIVVTYRAWASRRSKSYQGMDIHQRSGR